MSIFKADEQAALDNIEEVIFQMKKMRHKIKQTRDILQIECDLVSSIQTLFDVNDSITMAKIKLIRQSKRESVGLKIVK